MLVQPLQDSKIGEGNEGVKIGTVDQNKEDIQAKVGPDEPVHKKVFSLSGT